MKPFLNTAHESVLIFHDSWEVGMWIGIGNYRPILARKGSTLTVAMDQDFWDGFDTRDLRRGDIRLKIAFSLPTGFVRLPMLGRCS